MDWPELVESMLLDQRRKLMAQSARHIRHVLANSAYTAELLHLLQLPSFAVLPGGVDARRFRRLRNTRDELGLPTHKHLLMTACRLVPKKGLDLLLRAVSKLTHTHLLIAGDGREQFKCQVLAEQLGITDRVTFAGRVAQEDLRRYYWAADQFVLASREHVDRRTGLRDVETMGRVLCEAHAAGTPVIASRSGGIPSIVDDRRNGLLFEEDNLDALIQSIEQLRRDPDLSREMAAQGVRDATERWDWSVICASHEQAFRSSLSTADRASIRT